MCGVVLRSPSCSYPGGKDSPNRIVGGSVSPPRREKIAGVYRLLVEIRSRTKQLGIKGKAGSPQLLEPAWAPAGTLVLCTA